MTLYYSLVFMLLVAEMALFMLLIVPSLYHPSKDVHFHKRKSVGCEATIWNEDNLIFILILFIDSVNRVYRVQVELAESKDMGASAVLGHERMEVQARKFYSQRNMYLCGFTLFLSLILNRTYTLILDVLRLEEKVKKYEGDPSAGGKQGEKLENAGNMGEIAKLRKELAAKERDLETLKKQSEGLSREYGTLSDTYEATQKDGTPKKDK